VRWFPALELRWSGAPDPARLDRLLAHLDDNSPTAIEESPSGVRIFFGSRAQRECAVHRARDFDPAIACEPVDVPDDDWAERSQAALRSITAGNIVVSPPWDVTRIDGAITIIIQPSMGFGTGHHASTRLCLELLQRVPVAGASVLDVGTGSGVLAIAAATLGAARVVAVDNDADAVTAARENVARNDVEPRVELRCEEFAAMAAEFDLVMANLTGTLLSREARRLGSLVSNGGRVVASGIELHEADDVIAAFDTAGLTLSARVDQDGWTGLLLRK
jgi:ribosomal protein L11 methyltransferase